MGGRTAQQGYVNDLLRQKFTGYEHDDETGLDYAKVRYYANVQGRFISVDPLLSSGEPNDPQTWNRYAYALNSPLYFTDPTGMYVCKGSATQCGQFESRLNEAKENLKKIEKKYGEDSSQYDKANKSLNAYGGKDEKNGIFITFGERVEPGYTTGAFKNGKLVSITINFSPGTLDSNASQALVGHEGNHVNYFQTVGAKKDSYLFEYGGHEVQSLLGEAQFSDSNYYVTYGKNRDDQKQFDLWNKSWEGPDREKLRSNAIRNFLAIPKSEGGYGLTPTEPKAPAANRPRRRRG